jgi:CheY-like chemotaxis protein
VRSVMEARRHQLKVALPPDAVLVNADAARLTQIVANLLHNAAKYTPDGGHIELRAGRDAPRGQAVVAVRDNGMGIPADLLPRVFEMFTQGDGLPDRSRGGLGVGLCLVRSLVQMHGGTVEAHSPGRGQGSEFVVHLPLAGRASGIGEDLRSDFPPPAVIARRILVVDDNKDQADSLGMLLRLHGYQVIVAHDGFSAVEAAITNVPDVAVVDIGLPGLSGHDVARRIREHPDLRHMVLVAQTGWGQDGDRRRSVEAGFDHHLVKPVDHAELMHLLDEVRPASI